MIGEAFVFVCAFVALAYVVILWVNNIDYMDKNHKDYNGDDFL